MSNGSNRGADNKKMSKEEKQLMLMTKLWHVLFELINVLVGSLVVYIFVSVMLMINILFIKCILFFILILLLKKYFIE